MAFCTTLSLLLGLAAQAQPICERAPLVLPEKITVYVGVREDWRGYSGAAEQLRRAFLCYRAFRVVDDPFDADVDVRVISRVYYPRNARATHQIVVSVVGRAILPGTLWVGAESWEDCGHSLARGLIELLGTPTGPRGSDHGAV